MFKLTSSFSSYSCSPLLTFFFDSYLFHSVPFYLISTSSSFCAFLSNVIFFLFIPMFFRNQYHSVLLFIFHVAQKRIQRIFIQTPPFQLQRLKFCDMIILIMLIVMNTNKSGLIITYLNKFQNYSLKKWA